MTRLLLALLLACGGLVVAGAAGSPALACPATVLSLGQQTIRADDVFTGTITDREADGRTVLYTVRADRVYKGGLDAAEATVTTPAKPRDCGVPDLRVGDDYVFFTTGPDLETTSTTGTAPATDARLDRVATLLGNGRPATPAEPAEAQFTRVAGETTSLERMLAPGAAMVIFGLLGLVLVAGLGRRRG